MAKWYKFKQYYLIRHIATGGMAEIFLSKQIGLKGFEKLLVIKKILKQYAENPEFVSMFLDEAKLAAKLDHPNIIRIYDFGKEKKSYFIAMEYIAGEDLRTVLRKISKQKEIIPFQHTLQIVSSICDGIDYAHSKKDSFGNPMNIIHRDISPQNIMISYEGNVKILDFGIAKASTQTQETEAGVLKGKYAYMSPEQAKGKKLDKRSDIFAIGILLYEMLTSKRLFRADNQLDTLRKLVFEEIVSPRLINPNISEDLEKIVMKALAKDVNKRYQSARELQIDIEEFAAKKQIILSSTRTGNYMQKIFADEIIKLQNLEQNIDEEQKNIVEQEVVDVSKESGVYHYSEDSFVVKAPDLGSDLSTVSPELAIVPSEPPKEIKNNKKLYIFAGLSILVISLILFFIFSSNEKFATLKLNTNPSGALVEVEGKKHSDLTPNVIKKIPLNKSITLKIKKDGYKEELKYIKFDSEDIKEINIDLQKLNLDVAIVKLISKPENATIYFDNKKLDKKTPFTLEQVPAGEHSILLELDGYESYFKKFDLKKDSFEQIGVELLKKGQKIAYLTLSSLKKDSIIKINGKIVDSVNNLKVKANENIDINVSKKGYVNFSKTINLKNNEKETIAVNYERLYKNIKTRYGMLNVNTIKGANIYIDGKKLANTNISKRLKYGTHKVLISKPSEYFKYQAKIKINSSSVSKTIMPKKGKLAVSVRPWANVYINSIKVGQTPFAPKNLYEGNYVVELKNPNYQTIKKNIFIKAKKTKLLMEKFK